MIFLMADSSYLCSQKNLCCRPRIRRRRHRLQRHRPHQEQRNDVAPADAARVPACMHPSCPKKMNFKIQKSSTGTRNLPLGHRYGAVGTEAFVEVVAVGVNDEARPLIAEAPHRRTPKIVRWLPTKFPNYSEIRENF